MYVINGGPFSIFLLLKKSPHGCQLTQEDVAMKAGFLWRACSNVSSHFLSFANITAGNVDHQPVTPLPELGVAA